ncbi:uncharacterized protein LOC128393946 isoform X2 [Panonychus citri]|uniref:uncharacterized protein LOC128393946 isoform X2 n=1 Tax=Panonychus citri TaxID=50023 RepID=UPI0023078A08|nr:uncharacterized protein LOC128393946 isoform X2 [Panonychus citri]
MVHVPRIGIFVVRITDLQSSLDALRAHDYEFIVINVAREVERNQIIPLCDLLLSSTDWITHTAAYISTKECAVDLPRFRFLDAQFDQAQHLSIRDIIVECPEHIDAVTRLSRVLNARMSGGFTQSRFHVHLLLQSHRAQAHQTLANATVEPTEVTPHDSWCYWNHVRSLVGYDRRLGVALELDGDLPDEDDCKRWCGEAVSMLIVPFILFLPAANNTLALPQPYGEFIKSLLRTNARQISIMVKGNISPGMHSRVVKALAEYGRLWVTESLVNEFAIGYEDFLQVPLQPLADNLEASTYEIFEKDPVKYEYYRRAMVRALSKFPKDQRVVILLVGAGRGPLIRACLSASEETGRLINLYAIEKNFSAAFTLQSQTWVPAPENPETQVNKVTIVNTDIREWKTPELADILLSELLGSFGDNELSPECLDGAWKCVKPTAISIPESYRSYVEPIMSHRLYTETLAESAAKGIQYTDIHFVTHMKGFFSMADVKQLFEFVHTDLHVPPRDQKNVRYKKLRFRPHTECVLHGFAGYFDTTLIDDIKLSIIPEAHTPSLISWFPTWIPLSAPVKVTPADLITLHFWRNVNRQKVWYEWCIQSPIPTRIQNPNGKLYSIGLNS